MNDVIEGNSTRNDDARNGSVYDVVVVGAGAGGLNAALVLARARRRVAVVDAGEPRNAPATRVQGFLSRDGMSPAALLEVGRAEVAGYGVDLIEGQVDHIDTGFLVQLTGGPVLKARRVLVATGLHDELPAIPGVRERWGKDLLHCPYCHGYEVRDRGLGVLGTGPGSVHHALLLRQWSDDVALFAHTLDLSGEERERLAARGVRVVDGTVKRLAVDEDRLRGVELAEGRVVPRDAVFVAPRMVPRDGLLTGLGCERDMNGWVITDRSGHTTVPGVWAVGNVADPRALVVAAAGMGATAGFAVNHHLVDEETERAVKDRRATASLAAPPLPPASSRQGLSSGLVDTLGAPQGRAVRHPGSVAPVTMQADRKEDESTGKT
ncbi:NAD(P)/FAD-dependent oxidoreductase [Streptomyces sp. HNA39]|uniref:NAD(P)/FAD-dependent oxidoreductase n=1 Tax=Streptomyces sp. HNA39 TaxID=2850561 RepID=UPI00200E41E9|nr:NAD(P)/FAD-dependent oxidoreductase [Streptomyces sp. HNA39]